MSTEEKRKRIARLGKKRESQRKWEIVIWTKRSNEDIHPNMSNYRFLGFRSYLLLFSESRYHLSRHTDRGRTQEFKVVFFFGWQTGSAFPLTLAQIIFRLRLQLAEVHVLL